MYLGFIILIIIIFPSLWYLESSYWFLYSALNYWSLGVVDLRNTKFELAK
jgi:hypothetical protein